MIGNSLHYKKNISLNIGQYFQVYEDNTPCNSNKLYTKGAIYMGPSRNMQGSFKKYESRRSWDMIPISDTVIDWVNPLGKYEPELLVFTS